MKALQPLQIGPIKVAGRIFRSATFECTANIDGSPSEEHLKIYNDLTKGGCPLITTGAAYISTEGRINPLQNGIHNNNLIKKWKKITDEVHLNNGKIFMQLSHKGFVPPTSGIKPLLPPFLRRKKRFITCEISNKHILKIIEDFANAALRANNAGFDGIQLQANYGFLLGQFLSPLTNRRDDKWGGSVENRTRIITETVRKIKEKIPNFPITVKINSSDFIKNGLTPEDTAKAVKILSQEGVAAFELTGNITNYFKHRSTSSGPYFEKEGKYIKEKNREVVIGINGGIRSKKKIEELLDTFDFIAISRPFIKEPDLVNRFKQGQLRSECTSCYSCLLAQLKESTSLKCHNGNTRREEN